MAARASRQEAGVVSRYQLSTQAWASPALYGRFRSPLVIVGQRSLSLVRLRVASVSDKETPASASQQQPRFEVLRLPGNWPLVCENKRVNDQCLPRALVIPVA